jgi:acyl-lipid omega-6 desaturase (Delta-12 desaturase)
LKTVLNNTPIQLGKTTATNRTHPEKHLILAIREFAEEDSAKSWLYTVSTLLLLTLFFVGSAYSPNIYLRLICSLLSVFVFVRMFVIYHDFLHHAILYRSRLAKLIFWLFGLFTLAPVSIWKRSHNHHHKHNSKIVNGDIGPYPIMSTVQYLAADKTARFRYLASRHPMTILLAYFSIFLYGMCLQPFIKNSARHYDCFIALLLHFGFGYFLVSTGGMAAFMLTLFIPFSMSFALGAYLFYAQHNFPDVRFLNKTEWSDEKAAMLSSSYLEMGWFMRWATGNIGYHHIHHLNCTIPFYRLPEAMERIPELQNVKRTSLKIKDVLACLRLKLWDPGLNKMITLKEL